MEVGELSTIFHPLRNGRCLNQPRTAVVFCVLFCQWAALSANPPVCRPYSQGVPVPRCGFCRLCLALRFVPTARSIDQTSCALSALQCLLGSRQDARVVLHVSTVGACGGRRAVRFVVFASSPPAMICTENAAPPARTGVCDYCLASSCAHYSPIHNGSSDATGGFPCTGAPTAMRQALERCVWVSARGFDS